MMFRNKYERLIDAAHSNIASAEMAIAHSFTPDAGLTAEQYLTEAQIALASAIAARDAFNALPDDEMEPV